MSEFKEEVRDVDVLVIGAGPSGTVAASILKNSGLDVCMVEKQVFPRFVIGESLLPRCMENLDRAGLLETIKAGGFQQKFGAKFVRNDTICDFDFSDQYSKGWSWTWQVKRADFDHLLAKETEKKGVPIDYDAAVTAVHFHEDGSSETKVQKGSGQVYAVKAKYIVDASGYGRVLPRLLDLDLPSDFPMRMSFFCHLQDDNRPLGYDGNRITIVVYTQDVWMWVIPFSDGTTSVGLVGNPEIIEKFDGTLEEQYAQWLQEVPWIKGRFTIDDRKFEPRKIKGYSSTVKQFYGKGYVLTGNSTEFLDPVFSSGVTLATESGAVAATLIARTLKGEPVNWEVEYSEYIKRGVDVFRTFVSTWYDGTLQKILFAPNHNPELKSQICSVLAGYVWDESNPFVTKHERAVKALANVIKA